MDRIIGLEYRDGRARDERFKAEQLRHRRAAAERCVRVGILRRCTSSAPTQECRCST